MVFSGGLSDQRRERGDDPARPAHVRMIYVGGRDNP
jgi:hypothetical protein